MPLKYLSRPNIKYSWTHNNINLRWVHDHRHEPEEVCEHAFPMLRTEIHDCHALNEATYKEIASIIDSNFLNQKQRADALNGIYYRGFNNDTMVFEVNSAEFEDNSIRYKNLIQFENWDQTGQDPDLNAIEKARLLLWAGDIKLHCTCPSFLYWGYQYILTVLDSAIYPEQRFPDERNPQERGVVCKHLNRVLRALPFYNGDIAQAIQNQFGN